MHFYSSGIQLDKDTTIFIATRKSKETKIPKIYLLLFTFLKFKGTVEMVLSAFTPVSGLKEGVDHSEFSGKKEASHTHMCHYQSASLWLSFTTI